MSLGGPFTQSKYGHLVFPALLLSSFFTFFLLEKLKSKKYPGTWSTLSNLKTSSPALNSSTPTSVWPSWLIPTCPLIPNNIQVVTPSSSQCIHVTVLAAFKPCSLTVLPKTGITYSNQGKTKTNAFLITVLCLGNYYKILCLLPQYNNLLCV